MEIQIIDKKTGREPTERAVMNIAKKQGLMTMDIDQFAVCEDGQVILLDDCGRVAYCDMNRFTAINRWISCKEKLPEDLIAVNITWTNNNPEPYYKDIKSKKFVATGIHYRGKWYLYSSTCADCLAEYGSSAFDEIDKDIEILAWQPLPEPYNE